MKPHYPTRSALIATALMCGFCLPAGAQKANSPTTTVKDYFGDEKIILDTDGDGWDDLWTTIYPELKHRSKTTDTDGDGVTDYEEMVLWRNPMEKGPMPHKPTPEEIAESLRLAEIAKVENQARLVREWPARQAELAQTLRPSFEAGKDKADPPEVRYDNPELLAKIAARRNKAASERGQLKAKLDGIAEKYSVDREGSEGTLVGEGELGPIFMSPQDAVAANSIFADDLWPVGLYGWQDSSKSRNLTGAGIRASIFEANESSNLAGILTTHGEFNGGRAVQVDGAPPSNHATAVADVIIGGGIVDVFQGTTNRGKLLRGVAYAGQVRGHNLSDFVLETGNAVLDGQSFSNHSYGVTGGWTTVNVGGTNQWYWTAGSYTEDPRLGLYSPASADGTSSQELDEFVATTQIHLPVYASGNPNNSGPGNPVPPATTIPHRVPATGGGTVVSTVIRDWVNGDDGYDTVLSPATAKNVLTVGSITDINFTTSSFGISGFSGTGPTDDGRIKPDVAAVGQRNTTLGLGGSLFASHKTGSTTYYNGVIADGNGQTDLAGTSFAAPAVTGGLMLAEERRKFLLPGAGPLAASTWRAASIHSALDYGNPGPDYKTGWGIFDTTKLVSVLESDAVLGRGTLVKEFTVNAGQPKTFYVTLPASQLGELTLAWTDPAGSPPPFGSVLDDQTAMLVNNMDLSVQDVATLANHLPWVLNPDLPGKSATLRGAAAVRGTDNRNNVEKVTIDPTAQVRRLKVTVTPNGVLQGGSQKVSLILSGAIPESPVITTSGFTQNPLNPDEYSITFTSDPGAFYTMETSTTLDSGSWSDLSSVKAENSLTTVLTSRNPLEPRRFWRMRRGQ